MKLRRFIYIFCPPLIVLLIWFCSEKNVFYFPNFKFEAGFYDPKQLEETIGYLPTFVEQERKNSVLTKLPVSNNTLINVSAVLNQTILDKLGYFANMPLHRACLINQNRITSEGETIDPGESSSGAIGIIPANNQALNFYVEVSKGKDCKSVFKKDFRDEEFLPPEYVYPIFQEIGPEDMAKVFKGESYRVYLREISIDASDSRFILRLNYYIVFVAYLLVLLAWSIIYFQIRKLIYHIRGVKDYGN